MSKFAAVTIFIIVGFIGCFSSPVCALTDEEAFAQFQFNFMTPGARATAMGGAFIGLADDATAADTNPAGLTNLSAPEIFGELKHFTYSTEHIYSNVSIRPDSVNLEIVEKEYNDQVESLPFLSLVYPYKCFAFSLYLQESVNYKNSYRTDAHTIGLPGSYNPQTGDIYVILPRDTSVDLLVANYGVGMAFEVIEGFSAAISLRRSSLDMQSHSTSFKHDTVQASASTDFSNADVFATASIDGADTAYSVNAGLLWKLHPNISLGAVYRSGSEFHVAETFSGASDYNADAAEFTLDLPDVFGGGLAWRVTEFFTVTLDVLHLRYAELLNDFNIVWNQAQLDSANFTVQDATEAHVGVEYVFTVGERYLALRAGGYNEPDHTIRFTGTTGDPNEDAFRKRLFPGGDDQFHITGGMGIIMNQHLQIDTAVNIAETSTQISLSVVYHF